VSAPPLHEAIHTMESPTTPRWDPRMDLPHRTHLPRRRPHTTRPLHTDDTDDTGGTGAVSRW
jgi:hypothetical protein